eukprot:m.488262 g.488262  ORF g.488262 m.488262 type:complete len:147 (-) comp25678_c0_seq1:111-551(-)
MARAVKVMHTVKIMIKAGAAAPSPPLGPVLSVRGVNIGEFCKAFNAKTEGHVKGVPLPTTIYCKSDRSFSFDIAAPPNSWFLKQAAGVEKGANNPGKEIVGQVTLKQIYEIAKIKSQDVVFRNTDLQGVCKCLIGSARSMGIEIVR